MDLRFWKNTWHMLFLPLFSRNPSSYGYGEGLRGPSDRDCLDVTRAEISSGLRLLARYDLLTQNNSGPNYLLRQYQAAA